MKKRDEDSDKEKTIHKKSEEKNANMMYGNIKDGDNDENKDVISIIDETFEILNEKEILRGGSELKYA